MRERANDSCGLYLHFLVVVSRSYSAGRSYSYLRGRAAPFLPPRLVLVRTYRPVPLPPHAPLWPFRPPHIMIRTICTDCSDCSRVRQLRKSGFCNDCKPFEILFFYFMPFGSHVRRDVAGRMTSSDDRKMTRVIQSVFADVVSLCFKTVSVLECHESPFLKLTIVCHSLFEKNKKAESSCESASLVLTY